MKCETCKYYVETSDQNRCGHCRRYPEYAEIKYAENDWCGEYKEETKEL